ncbi:DEKNAAC100243 [Brettanomyces naardenensis]|uniref:DEKNAAC100243 n=1 Tax=Brettanomyces naardenensis TaxID=13370 RepID=A0A448YGA1_BRENA|nr:DEKNAAC100243 [Brettanomyces naardenensis]
MPPAVEKATFTPDLNTPSPSSGSPSYNPTKSSHKRSHRKNSSNERVDIPQAIKGSNLTNSQKVSLIHEINSKNQSSKNLSHVPCKFFRQGACQAGDSCPFSHATDAASEFQPCKYFLKGNCKFGMKCALAHILPDGRILNQRSVPRGYRSESKRHSQYQSGKHAQHAQQSRPEVSSSEPATPTKSSATSATSASSNSAAAIQSTSKTAATVTTVQPVLPSSASFYQQDPAYKLAQQPIGVVSQVPYTEFKRQQLSQPAYLCSPISSQMTLSSSSSGNLTTSPLNGSIWSPTSSPTSVQSSHSVFFRTMSGPSQTRPTQLWPSMRRSSSSALMPLFHKSSELSKDPTEDAISDDSEEEALLEDDEESPDTDDAYGTDDVDFLPDSLTDLLTPQELKRRSSKQAYGNPRPLLSDGAFVMD